jgi:hypothetical protein
MSGQAHNFFQPGNVFSFLAQGLVVAKLIIFVKPAKSIKTLQGEQQ